MSRNSICLLFVVLFIASSCSNSIDSVGSRTVVVLTPDEVGEIVLPPGAFEPVSYSHQTLPTILRVEL